MKHVSDPSVTITNNTWDNQLTGGKVYFGSRLQFMTRLSHCFEIWCEEQMVKPGSLGQSKIAPPGQDSKEKKRNLSELTVPFMNTPVTYDLPARSLLKISPSPDSPTQGFSLSTHGPLGAFKIQTTSYKLWPWSITRSSHHQNVFFKIRLFF